MLSRQASLQYVIKQQAVLAETARDSERWIRFFKALRAVTVLNAISIVGVAISLAIIAVSSIANGSGNGAVGFLLISLFMLGFSSLILATEGLQARCVARFFGFMSLNVWKGLYIVSCGLAVSWVGNVYKVMDNYSPGASTFDVATFVIGMANVGAGLAWMLFGSCNFVAIRATPLKEEFANYRAAMLMFHEIARKEQQTGTDQVTVTIRRPAEPEPPSQAVAAVSATNDEVAIRVEDTPSNPFAKQDPESNTEPLPPPPPREPDVASTQPKVSPMPPTPPVPHTPPIPPMPPVPPPPSEPDAGSTPLNPFSQPPADSGDNPFDRPSPAGMPVVDVEIVGDNPFDLPAPVAPVAPPRLSGDSDDLQKGEEVYYSHRTLGAIPVRIVNIDMRGAFDGGVTYLVEGPLLDGVVETMRNRLTRTKPE